MLSAASIRRCPFAAQALAAACLILHGAMQAGEQPASANLLRFPADVTLQAPLTTLIECPESLAGSRRLRISLVVPGDAPSDLGIGVFARDHHGRWFQRPLPGRLAPGRHDRVVELHAAATLRDEIGASGWNAELAATSTRSGIYFWSSSSSQARITVSNLQVERSTPDNVNTSLCDVTVDGLGPDHVAHGTTGERWSVMLRPDPWPTNPYDPDEFQLDGRITLPNGNTVTIPGFCLQPMSLADRGDREQALPVGPAHFAVRFRPWLPGRHHIALVWSSGASGKHTLALPDLLITGSLRQDIVRVDSDDPRFFTNAGAWWWPIGINLHSTFDKRSLAEHKTILTPPRGTLVYHAMLDRFAAAGGNAVEIWMSSWNLSLEWRAEWPEYQGIGRYNQANAWRLDEILDHAQRVDMKVNLVINNHGQASPRTDKEWKDNPYNTANGGPLAEPALLFSDPNPLAGQERIRRYLVARYADHPAILGWKLWSEFDLTAGRGPLAVPWHTQAAARWHSLDVYRHPVTTHWAGDYRRVDPAVAELPGLDYLTVDSYRYGGTKGTPWTSLADILVETTQHDARGLLRYRKPILVTEYGGASGSSPETHRDVDHRIGAWLAMVSGHAGSPMLWWWEWVDQGQRWQPYRAIRSFLIGEELRGKDAGSAMLTAGQPAGPLCCRAWIRPGRMLVYMVDPEWARSGGVVQPTRGAWIDIGDQVSAGPLTATWWDCDTGTVQSEQSIQHTSGHLRLKCPDFVGHLALKLVRQ